MHVPGGEHFDDMLCKTLSKLDLDKSGDALVLKEDADANLLKEAKAKLEAAHAAC